jgi:hypothetical protein
MSNLPVGRKAVTHENVDAITTAMTKLLESGIEAVRALPEDRQDMAGELLLSLAASGPQYRLTAEQLDDVRLAMSEADRGDYASDQDMAETWKKFQR